METRINEGGKVGWPLSDGTMVASTSTGTVERKNVGSCLEY